MPSSWLWQELGAWEAGNDVAAEVYMWSSDSNLSRGDLAKAYSNALQAVTLRPNNLTYWRALIQRQNAFAAAPVRAG